MVSLTSVHSCLHSWSHPFSLLHNFPSSKEQESSTPVVGFWQFPVICPSMPKWRRVDTTVTLERGQRLSLFLLWWWWFFFFFLFLVTPYTLWDLSFPTRGQTHSGSSGSQPLDCQGSAEFGLFWISLDATHPYPSLSRLFVPYSSALESEQVARALFLGLHASNLLPSNHFLEGSIYT